MGLRFACWSLAAFALAACGHEPQLARPNVGPSTEHSVYDAIDAVHASDAQRLAILNAYDANNGRLRELSTRSNEVLEQWKKLDRTAQDFSARIEALAVQWAQVNAEEMTARSAFERQVATSLSPEQWRHWQDFMAGRAGQDHDYYSGGSGPQEQVPGQHY